MEVKPIGVIHTPFKQASGTPIQPVFAADTRGEIEVFPQYADGLKDLDGFERIWVLFWLDRASKVRLLVKPYRDENLRGVFATRAPARPNPIGLSCVRLLSVKGCKLDIAEVDILDGTPLLDIKPYCPEFDSFEVTRFGWLQNKAKTDIADNRFFDSKSK